MAEDLAETLRNAGYAAVKKRISEGLPVDTRLDRGETILLASIWVGRKGLEAFIAWLLEKGADVNASSETGRTALQQAAWQHQPGIVRILLAHGANVNAIEGEGRTALHMAATG